MEAFDPAHLKLTGTPRTVTNQEPLPEKRIRPQHRDRKFLKGPVPLAWLMEAAKLPGKALAVGVALWYLSGIKRSRTVTLPSSHLYLFGVDRHAKTRALAVLENGYLVAVQRCNGKNPVVTLLTTGEGI